MKIITNHGEIVSQEDVDAGNLFTKYCVISDRHKLIKKYLLTLFRESTGEFIKEIILTEKPTKEMMMYVFIENNLKYDGYATVQEIYTLGWEESEEE